jgi:hypothetical protein
MAISKIGWGVVLGLVVAFGAAAQDNRPASDAPKPLVRDQANASEDAKRSERDTARQANRQDISRDPDRSAIGPRTTQGLAQDAISRSNSR